MSILKISVILYTGGKKINYFLNYNQKIVLIEFNNDRKTVDTCKQLNYWRYVFLCRYYLKCKQC